MRKPTQFFSGFTLVELLVVISCAAAQSRVLIPHATEGGATWRYTTDQPGDTWTKAEFDDGAWAEGQSGFGVTDQVTQPATVRTPWTTSQIWLARPSTSRHRWHSLP